MHVPDLGSHNLIKLSLLPEMRIDFWGCQERHFTSQPWPVKMFSSWHRPKSQILILTSSEHEANFRSVGLNLQNIKNMGLLHEFVKDLQAGQLKSNNGKWRDTSSTTACSNSRSLLFQKREEQEERERGREKERGREGERCWYHTWENVMIALEA